MTPDSHWRMFQSLRRFMDPKRDLRKEFSEAAKPMLETPAKSDLVVGQHYAEKDFDILQIPPPEPMASVPEEQG